MKNNGATFRKYSSAGVDWASWFLGIGLGLTLALQVTTMRKSDISSVYAVVASVSRLAALTGTFFAVMGIFLIARIPWVERGVGHDRLVTWHRKLGPWNIGIASPGDVEKYVKFFDVTDGSVATSGDYEKGAHIVDPLTGLIAIGARSATVIGPDGAICDALATALMVDGVDAQKWIGREELAEYSFWTINRHDGTAWSYGSNKGY